MRARFTDRRRGIEPCKSYLSALVICYNNIFTYVQARTLQRQTIISCFFSFSMHACYHRPVEKYRDVYGIVRAKWSLT